MKIIAIALFVGCIGAVGRMDFDDHIAQQEHYCKMVAEGVWPAYNQNINCDTESGNAKNTSNSKSKTLYSSQTLHARG
jgi:hypothetical protein